MAERIGDRLDFAGDVVEAEPVASDVNASVDESAASSMTGAEAVPDRRPAYDEDVDATPSCPPAALGRVACVGCPLFNRCMPGSDEQETTEENPADAVLSPLEQLRASWRPPGAPQANAIATEVELPAEEDKTRGSQEAVLPENERPSIPSIREQLFDDTVEIVVAPALARQMELPGKPIVAPAAIPQPEQVHETSSEPESVREMNAELNPDPRPSPAPRPEVRSISNPHPKPERKPTRHLEPKTRLSSMPDPKPDPERGQSSAPQDVAPHATMPVVVQAEKPPHKAPQVLQQGPAVAPSVPDAVATPVIEREAVPPIDVVSPEKNTEQPDVSYDVAQQRIAQQEAASEEVQTVPALSRAVPAVAHEMMPEEVHVRQDDSKFISIVDQEAEPEEVLAQADVVEAKEVVSNVPGSEDDLHSITPEVRADISVTVSRETDAVKTPVVRAVQPGTEPAPVIEQPSLSIEKEMMAPSQQPVDILIPREPEIANRVLADDDSVPTTVAGQDILAEELLSERQVSIVDAVSTTDQDGYLRETLPSVTLKLYGENDTSESKVEVPEDIVPLPANIFLDEVHALPIEIGADDAHRPDTADHSNMAICAPEVKNEEPEPQTLPRTIVKQLQPEDHSDDFLRVREEEPEGFGTRVDELSTQEITVDSIRRYFDDTAAGTDIPVKSDDTPKVVQSRLEVRDSIVAEFVFEAPMQESQSSSVEECITREYRDVAYDDEMEYTEHTMTDEACKEGREPDVTEEDTTIHEFSPLFDAGVDPLAGVSAVRPARDITLSALLGLCLSALRIRTTMLH